MSCVLIQVLIIVSIEMNLSTDDPKAKNHVQ